MAVFDYDRWLEEFIEAGQFLATAEERKDYDLLR
jgi:hypothetical protein